MLKISLEILFFVFYTLLTYISYKNALRKTTVPIARAYACLLIATFFVITDDSPSIVGAVVGFLVMIANFFVGHEIWGKKRIPHPTNPDTPVRITKIRNIKFES